MSEAIPTDQYNQHIPLVGTPNFRDLGGRINSKGQTVKRGKLFRSGFLSALSDEDWQKFNALNITKICDFRRHDELERNPTSAPLGVDITHLPIGDGSHHELIKKAFTQPNVEAERVVEFMKDINREFVIEHAESYRQYFEQVLDLEHDEALLFHCSAGKDRTGFAAAITLMALGVDKPGVFEDYMLSMRFFNPEKEMARIIAMLPGDQLDAIEPKTLHPILTTEISYLETAFSMIESVGGFEKYAKQHLKLSESAFSKLRDTLLSN